MLVGIGHADRVGKTTAAQALVRDLGFVEVPIAAALKEIVRRADPMVIPTQSATNVAAHNRLSWVVTGFGGDEAAKDRYPEVRRLYREFGTAVRDVLGEDVWIDKAMKTAKRHERAVLPDVRFLNEAERVREAGGLLIKITRPGYKGGSHSSEVDLADFTDWDLEFDNTGSVIELQLAVVEFVRTQLRKVA